MSFAAESGMKALPKILLALTAVAAFSLAYPASVQAVPTTYQYTGNPFTQVGGPVTAMVTLAAPLTPNMSLTFVTPLAFTLNDGVQTITNLTVATAFFEFATGTTGEITQWLFTGDNSLNSFIDSNNTPGVQVDQGVRAPGEFGGNANAPGTWSVVGTVPDTGSTLSLMTLTLMALGLVARRFQRAA